MWIWTAAVPNFADLLCHTDSWSLQAPGDAVWGTIELSAGSLARMLGCSPLEQLQQEAVVLQVLPLCR